MKILVIDDEKLIARSLVRAGESRGHQMRMEIGGLDGLRSWQEMDPDVVILDVLLPDISGPEILQKMAGGRARVILISAYSGDFQFAEAQTLGVDRFIRKPFLDIFAVIQSAEELMAGVKQ